MSTPPEFSGTPRRAPAAPGSGIPADRHEAYRRGLCGDCRTAWHAAGMPRCAPCHAVYAAGGGPPTLTVVTGGKRGSGPWRPQPSLTVVKTA